MPAGQGSDRVMVADRVAVMLRYLFERYVFTKRLDTTLLFLFFFVPMFCVRYNETYIFLPFSCYGTPCFA